jgi:photosystem II stability/assembly factor-like uncharacterized protein
MGQYLLRFMLSFLLILMASFPVYAGQSEAAFPSLNIPASPARNISGALLIAITRAGDRLVAGGAHGVIIYSDDNGANWKQASVPVSLTITDIAFATPTIGWAVGAYGVVLHTSDGGQSWVRQLTGLDVNNLMLANATSVAAASPDSPQGARALRRANIFVAAGPDKPLLAVDVQDASHVTIFGAYRICIRTSDAGATWQDCSLSVPDPVSHNLYGIAHTAAGTYVVGESGDIFLMDGTGAFSSIPSPAEATLFGMIVTTKNTLLAYGVAGTLYRSADGGKDWAPVSIAAQSDLTAGLQLASGAIILLSGTGTIYVSNDDGQRFQTVSQNTGEVLCAGVQAANSNIVLAGLSGIRVLQPSALQ